MAAIQRSHQITPPQARPAEPLLATSLIDSASLNAIFDRLNISTTSAAPPITPEILKTGTKSLDDALASTLQPGRLSVFTSETSTQRDDLAKSLIVDCLISESGNSVAVVDSTGNFDVVGLYTRILRRVERESRCSDETGAAIGGHEAQKKEDVAARVLDRVKIMRVFDFVGFKEAVGELRDGLEGRNVQTKSVPAGGASVVKMSGEETPVLKKRLEVADSEDEDEGLEEDDEMLFDVEAQPANPVATSSHTASPDIAPEPHDTANSQPQPNLKLILIDNLAHVITPLLKKDTLSGNTLATTFLTTLSDLTRTHAIHTILLNPSTTPRAPSPARQPPTRHQQAAPAPQQTYVPQPPPPPSIFSSNTTVPALLGLLGRYVDAHILLTRMPRRKLDARVFYADTGDRERGKRRGVEMVGVLEIIADRWGGRVGAWGWYVEGKDGEAL